jgi:hypothetical protein
MNEKEQSALTTITYILLSVAQTLIRTPPLHTNIAASFWKVLKLDFQSMGIRMKNNKVSVETLQTKDTHRMGFEMAAWHTIPGV